jgi:hypothetical protein
MIVKKEKMNMPDKKMKLSMFLEPDFAKAVKIQAARQGAGVSEIMRSVVSCAHCHDPITDEFVIGEPTQVAQGKYNVFFHKNKPECRKASGERIPYVPICNKCKEPAYQSYKREDLSTLIQSDNLKFYCIRCNESWPASMEDVRQLSSLLSGSKEYIKIDEERNITYIITSARDLTDNEIDSLVSFYIKNNGQPQNGTTNIINLWTPDSRMPF